MVVENLPYPSNRTILHLRTVQRVWNEKLLNFSPDLCATFQTYLSQRMIFNHDVSPDGETQSQPDGDGVNHEREVDVEQHHHPPAPAPLQQNIY